MKKVIITTLGLVLAACNGGSSAIGHRTYKINETTVHVLKGARHWPDTAAWLIEARKYIADIEGEEFAARMFDINVYIKSGDDILPGPRPNSRGVYATDSDNGPAFIGLRTLDARAVDSSIAHEFFQHRYIDVREGHPNSGHSGDVADWSDDANAHIRWILQEVYGFEVNQ